MSKTQTYPDVSPRSKYIDSYSRVGKTNSKVENDSSEFPNPSNFFGISPS